MQRHGPAVARGWVPLDDTQLGIAEGHEQRVPGPPGEPHLAEAEMSMRGWMDWAEGGANEGSRGGSGKGMHAGEEGGSPHKLHTLDDPVHVVPPHDLKNPFTLALALLPPLAAESHDLQARSLCDEHIVLVNVPECSTCRAVHRGRRVRLLHDPIEEGHLPGTAKRRARSLGHIAELCHRA